MRTLRGLLHTRPMPLKQDFSKLAASSLLIFDKYQTLGGKNLNADGALRERRMAISN